jgi:dUTP pyrophosphatase
MPHQDEAYQASESVGNELRLISNRLCQLEDSIGRVVTLLDQDTRPVVVARSRIGEVPAKNEHIDLERIKRQVTIKYQKVFPGAICPRRAYGYDACWDIYLPDNLSIFKVHPGDDLVLGLGFKTAIPQGWCLHILARSSTQPYVCHGIIDPDYRKEWRIRLRNTTTQDKEFRGGDRIAQAYLVEIVEQEWVPVEALPLTIRGAGWGSSGR